MATWRLVLPNGRDNGLAIGVKTKLSREGCVEIEEREEGYCVRNCGEATVVLLYGNEEEILEVEESKELDRECAMYVEGQKEATMQRVVPGRTKKQKTTQWIPRFGFKLYRLRKDRHQSMQPYETDLASWFDGDATYAFLSDFMIDLDWLISAVPSIASIPKILIVHGETQDHHLKHSIKQHGLDQIDLHRPPLPIPFGTHHSKVCILKFSKGLRVVVHTANLIYCDCGEKTQGAWIQDFPSKNKSSGGSAESTSRQSAFEIDLLRYLRALKIPTAEFNHLVGIIKEHDFTAARVKLIPSVPGYHTGEAMKRFGHLLLKETLSKEIFSDIFASSPLVCQYSSLGSLDPKWLYEEFLPSLSAGKIEDSMKDLGSPSTDASGLQLVWPTISQVKHSLEGWSAGRSIPGASKNVHKPFLKQHWHKFDGDHLNRTRAMPHIKTFARYASNRLAWVLLTSSNLSKAAWGTVQKKGTQFMIRSYELGVLFLPSLERHHAQSTDSDFSCSATSLPPPPAQDITLVPFPSTDDADASRIQFCLPYGLPPKPYGDDDVPWVADQPMRGQDALGHYWGHGQSMYGLLESND